MNPPDLNAKYMKQCKTEAQNNMHGPVVKSQYMTTFGYILINFFDQFDGDIIRGDYHDLFIKLFNPFTASPETVSDSELKITCWPSCQVL